MRRPGRDELNTRPTGRHDREPEPPSWMERLLHRHLPAGTRGASILGDMREEFIQDHRDVGRARACLRYFRNVLSITACFAGRNSSNQSSSRNVTTPRKTPAVVLSGIVQDIRYALRSLVKNPAFALVAVLTLALGIGANTAVFSVLNGILLKPLHYEDPDRLVRIYQTHPTYSPTGSVVSGPAFLDYRDLTGAFDNIAGMYDLVETGFTTDQPRGDYRGVIAGYFETMGIPVIRGRRFDDFDGRDGRNVAIINQRLAERFFSASDPIGKTISIPMFQPMEIVGVVADVRHDGLQSDARPEIFIPFSQLPVNEMHIVMYTREESGDISSLVQGEVLKLDPRLPITKVADISDLLANSIAQPRFSMVLFIGLAFCALILAVIGTYGVISYSVSQRTREIGLRMALGADAGGTVFLIVSQTLRLVAIGMVLGIPGGLALSRFLGSLLHGITPTDVPTYVIVCILILVAGLSAAAVPARRAARVDPADALRYE